MLNYCSPHYGALDNKRKLAIPDAHEKQDGNKVITC